MRPHEEKCAFLPEPFHYYPGPFQFCLPCKLAFCWTGCDIIKYRNYLAVYRLRMYVTWRLHHSSFLASSVGKLWAVLGFVELTQDALNSLDITARSPITSTILNFSDWCILKKVGLARLADNFLCQKPYQYGQGKTKIYKDLVIFFWQHLQNVIDIVVLFLLPFEFSILLYFVQTLIKARTPLVPSGIWAFL